MSNDYASLERDIRGLLAELGDAVGPDADQEIQMFLDAGEYGLAFEIICSVLRAQGKSVSESVFAHIVDIGERMDVDSEQWLGLDV